MIKPPIYAYFKTTSFCFPLVNVVKLAYIVNMTILTIINVML